MMTRRELLRTGAAGAAALALPNLATAEDAKGFTLPELPYDVNALEPSIDGETMTIHHTKHHQAYVDNLNKALGGQAEWLAKPIAEVVANYKKLPEAIRTAVRNNGGGHLNHSWFWQMMAPTGKGGEPKGELLKAIDDSFGSLDGFKKAFSQAGLTQFGSGWAWLVKGKDKPLAVEKTANQDSPLMEGRVPLLGCDVWEHAYYLKYRNLRAKYLEAWFAVVNWEYVSEAFANSKK
jgi:Fe-Mn family superoxide dismutase